jgi:hypothetical protein
MPVCIAGMHRSGTSMVTKMLRDAGLDLGAEADLTPRNVDAVERHWEHRRFFRINADILGSLGGAWDYPPPVPEEWDDARLDAPRAAAAALLAEFAGREPWGWKDPRNSLTLPFWQELADDLRVVIVVRHPLETAMSLRQRHGFSLVLGLALWQVYNERLDHAAGPDRVVTHFERYFYEPAAELRRVLELLELPVHEEAVERGQKARIPELRRNLAAWSDLRAAGASEATLDLYQRLCAEAGWPVAAADGAEASHAGGVAAEPEWWDDPEVAGRPKRQQEKPGRPFLMRQLDAANARIAELERTVEAQRRALAARAAPDEEMVGGER